MYAQGENEGFGIDDATVVVSRLAPDRSETTLRGTTDSQGIATIRIPASSPGTRLTIRVEKPGLAAKTISKQIGLEVAAFDPQEIKSSLNRETKEDATTILTISNQVTSALLIKKFRVNGSFRGLLDEERMNAFLSQYEGSHIVVGEVKGVEILSAIGSEAEFLDAPVKAKGTVKIEFSLDGNGSATQDAVLPPEL